MNAENVAINQSSATAVMNDWMNSSGHKENILSKKATTIGVGCFYIMVFIPGYSALVQIQMLRRQRSRQTVP